MKHSAVTDDLPSEQEIRAALHGIGVETTCEQAALLAMHARLVLAANRRFNLTAITERTRFVSLHIADAALGVQEIAHSPAGAIVDIGSGAGYPGVVLCVLTGRAVTLLEATRKKAEFLRDVADVLGIPAVARHARAEELAAEQPGSFAIATARGVARLSTLVELASPLLVRGGRLLAYKARVSESERLDGDRAASLCGMRHLEDCARALPSGEWRTIVVYERCGESEIALPRRPGLPFKRPLG